MAKDLHIVCPACLAVNRVPDDRLTSQPQCGACKQSLFRAQPAELNSTAFDKHLARSDLPLLVDFWASWCGPCRMMAPAYEQAARQLEPHVRVAKVNTEEVREVAARYGIRSIPTLVLFKNGREASRQSGAMDAGRILAWVRSSL